MKIKKIIFIVLLVSMTITICACSTDDECFANLEVGETFYHNTDGYFEKLPHDYCLQIDLGSTTRLFQVPYYKLYNSLYNDTTLYLEESIIEDHYIKGYYNEEFLILCNESEEGYSYLSFEFETKEIEYFPDENTVYERFDFSSEQWFSLSNTLEQRIDHDGPSIADYLIVILSPIIILLLKLSISYDIRYKHLRKKFNPEKYYKTHKVNIFSKLTYWDMRKSIKKPIFIFNFVLSCMLCISLVMSVVYLGLFVFGYELKILIIPTVYIYIDIILSFIHLLRLINEKICEPKR